MENMEKSKKKDEKTNSDTKEKTLLCQKIKLESNEIVLWDSINRNTIEAHLGPQNIKTESVFDDFSNRQGFIHEFNEPITRDIKQVKIKCENPESGLYFESEYLKTEIEFKHEEYCAKEEEDEEEEKKESNTNHQQSAKLHKCHRCPFATVRWKGLKMHMRTHDQSHPYNCPHCDRTFNRKNGLDNHVLKRHGDDVETLKTISNKIHECRRCEYKTVIKTHMNSHVVAKHGGDFVGAKTHKCDWCNYDTYLKSNLRQHMRTHSFSKTFVCAACTRAFNQKLQLDSHVFTQHKTDTELQETITNKIHDCPHCDYRSVISSHVKSHVKANHEKV